MSVLVVDIGNSRVKWAQYCNGQLLAMQACSYDKNALAAALTRHWAGLVVAEIWCANVAGEHVAHQLVAWADAHWQAPVYFAQARAQCNGVRNAYLLAARLGVDRWLALLAAAQRYPQRPCIVVDSGTALTLDVLSAQGEHLGGWIVPGLGLMRQSLQDNAAALRQLDLSSVPLPVQPDELVWGKNTQHGVKFGTVYALSALIEKAFQHYHAEGAVCVLTGGALSEITPVLRCAYVCIPELVLQGIVLDRQSCV